MLHTFFVQTYSGSETESLIEVRAESQFPSLESYISIYCARLQYYTKLFHSFNLKFHFNLKLGWLFKKPLFLGLAFNYENNTIYYRKFENIEK